MSVSAAAISGASKRALLKPTRSVLRIVTMRCSDFVILPTLVFPRKENVSLVRMFFTDKEPVLSLWTNDLDVKDQRFVFSFPLRCGDRLAL